MELIESDNIYQSQGVKATFPVNLPDRAVTLEMEILIKIHEKL